MDYAAIFPFCTPIFSFDMTDERELMRCDIGLCVRAIIQHSPNLQKAVSYRFYATLNMLHICYRLNH